MGMRRRRGNNHPALSQHGLLCLERCQFRGKGRIGMWKVCSIFLLLLATSQLNPQTAAQPDGERVGILSLENPWNQALQQKVAAALKMLLSSDLIYVDHDGTLMNKEQYLSSVRSPTVHPGRIVNESVTVHQYGSVAVVCGVCRESGVKNGKAYALRERFMDTWIRRNDSWVCVASQSSFVGGKKALARSPWMLCRVSCGRQKSLKAAKEIDLLADRFQLTSRNGT